MNLAQLITDIQARIQHYHEAGMSKKQIDACLRSLGDIATQEMMLEEGEIPLPGLGKLKAGQTNARDGRNPATGAAIRIPAKNTVKFVAAKALKDALA